MIAGMTYYQVLWYFLIYSFFGWCVEVIFHAVKVGKVINRGFLCGPLCPVYGFGVLTVFSMTKSLLPHLTGMQESVFTTERSLPGLLIVFAAGVILATAVELLAGWLLDQAFHMRWWDYTNEPMNLHGYICARFSIIWGLAIVFVVRIVQPMMEMSTAVRLPERVGWWVLLILYLVLAADFIVTVLIVAGLNKKLKELDEVQREMKTVSDRLSYVLATGTMKTQENVEHARVQTALAKMEARDAAAEAKEALGDAAEGAKAAWKSASAEAKETLEDAAEGAKAAWKSASAEAKETLEDAAEGAKVAWKSASAEAKETLEDAAEGARAAWKSSAGRTEELRKRKEELEKRSAALREKLTAGPLFGSGRILRAFPTSKHRTYGKILEELRKKYR